MFFPATLELVFLKPLRYGAAIIIILSFLLEECYRQTQFYIFSSELHNTIFGFLLLISLIVILLLLVILKIYSDDKYVTTQTCLVFVILLVSLICVLSIGSIITRFILSKCILFWI